MLLLLFGLSLLVALLSIKRSSASDKTKQNCRTGNCKWFHDGCLTVQPKRGRPSLLSRFDQFKNRRCCSVCCNLDSASTQVRRTSFWRSTEIESETRKDCAAEALLAMTEAFDYCRKIAITLIDTDQPVLNECYRLISSL